ncbi:MAG: OsmC family protein [Gemmatimonadetes bacterium]|nr:OsmC family protein [Gemmatimonadota bacterium]
MEGVWSEYPMEVVWEGGKRFRAGQPGGPTLVVDGERQAGPSPVEALVIALGSCSAIDIVDILEKRRTPVERLEVRVEFARAASPPRRITAARVHFRVTTASELSHVQRAADLSFEKYCSVSTSLAPDTELTWEVEVEPSGVGVETSG